MIPIPQIFGSYGDVSKDKFDACGIGEQGEKIFSISVLMRPVNLSKRVL